MTTLSASAKDRRIDPHSPEFRECLEIRGSLSEVEFLHEFEACSVALDHADKTGLSSLLGKRLLPPWIELGRPHPVILRWFLLGLGYQERVPQSVDRPLLTEFLDWSWEAFNLVRKLPSKTRPNMTLEAKRKDDTVIMSGHPGGNKQWQVTLTKEWGLDDLYKLLQGAVNHAPKTESLKFTWPK